MAEGKGVEISCIFVVWAQIFSNDWRAFAVGLWKWCGKNVSLKTENLALAQELEELKKTIALQKNALAELKDENKLIKLAKEMSMSGSDVHDLKIKINELVKDIDRCIDLLNE